MERRLAVEQADREAERARIEHECKMREEANR